TDGTTSESEQTSPTSSVTDGTTSESEQTSPTSLVTGVTDGTTSESEQTSPTSSVTDETTSESEQTSPTSSVTGVTDGTTSEPEQTSPTSSVTGVTDGTTSEPEQTSPTSSVTGVTDGTTSEPEQTSPTSSVTGLTDGTTSEPEQTSPTSSVTEPIESSTPSDTTSLTGPPTTVPSEATTEPETTSSQAGTSGSVTTPSPDSAHTDSSVTAPTGETTLESEPTNPTDSVTTKPVETIASTVPLTSQPVQTTSKITTAQPPNCQNGGTYNGFNCTCRPGFTGELCQNVDTFKPDTFDQSVVVNMVVNEKYDDKYDDKESTEYKGFVENLTERMRKYYNKTVPTFKNVIVTSVSRGDPLVRFVEARTFYATTGGNRVRVAHDVVLKIDNTNTAGATYNNSVDDVLEALKNLQNCVECDINIESSTVDRQEVDLTSLCKSHVENQDIAHYYKAVLVDGIYECFTPCDAQYPDGRKICKNKGTCKLYSGQGPVCECQHLNTTWYLGSDCDLPIQKTAFYAGLSVTLACLLVMIIALIVNTFVNKNKQTKKKDIKKKLVNEWLNEDYEWSRSNTPVNGLKTSFKNPVYQEKDLALYNENSFRQQSGSFSPPQTLDTYNNMLSNPGYSQPPTNRNFSGDVPMRIIRPQIRNSWDT
ncbi:mucin-17, partial [Austrofundulus limnaeus]|uniref:Mucin-17 n=1 Tax=Austrofundulus limnaeus TaxID=52670 RepID=A0A2I4CB03_AUSLI